MPYMLYATGAAASVFFLVMWVRGWWVERNKTEIQRRRDQIAAEAERAARGTWRQRLARFADAYGWDGSLTLPLIGLGFFYLLVAGALAVFGIGGIVGVIVALPTSVAALLAVARTMRLRRKRQFNRQLVEALDAFATQLRAGSSAKRAIAKVAPTLPEPLSSEMAWVVAQAETNRKLADAMAELGARYPSKAMRLLVVALRIDDEKGAEIAPAFDSAAATTRREFELSAEAQAEVAQSRFEFYGIVGMMAAIVWIMVSGADSSSRAAYTEPAGLIALGVGLANFAFGVFRIVRILNRARGEV